MLLLGTHRACGGYCARRHTRSARQRRWRGSRQRRNSASRGRRTARADHCARHARRADTRRHLPVVARRAARHARSTRQPPTLVHRVPLVVPPMKSEAWDARMGAHAVGRSANSLRSARRHSAMDSRAAVRSGAQWSRLRCCLSNGAWHLHVPLRRPLLPSCAWIWTCLRKWSILSQLRSGDTWTG